MGTKYISIYQPICKTVYNKVHGYYMKLKMDLSAKLMVFKI